MIMPATPDLACIFLALGAGLASGLAQVAATRPPLRIPWATLFMLALLAVAFGAQLAVPGLLPLFQRNSSLIERAELWRAVTALVAQEGAVTGAVFNLTILLVIGSVAEQTLGARRWLVVYLGAGVVTEFLALAWQPQGAGNSIAVFALAGALTALNAGAERNAARILIRSIAAAAGLGLLAQRDIHGIGFWMGAAITLGLSMAGRASTPERSPQRQTTQA